MSAVKPLLAPDPLLPFVLSGIPILKFTREPFQESKHACRHCHFSHSWLTKLDFSVLIHRTEYPQPEVKGWLLTCRKGLETEAEVLLYFCRLFLYKMLSIISHNCLEDTANTFARTVDSCLENIRF